MLAGMTIVPKADILSQWIILSLPGIFYEDRNGLPRAASDLSTGSYIDMLAPPAGRGATRPNQARPGRVSENRHIFRRALPKGVGSRFRHDAGWHYG